MKKQLTLIILTVIFSSCFYPLNAQILKGKGFQEIRIGDIEGVVLTDGYGYMAPVQSVMAPDTDLETVNAWLSDNYERTDGVGLPMNILLLKKNDRFILFDSGSGSGMGETTGWLLPNLKMIGISPEQITDIVITHAHLDHIAGLLDSQGKSVFPHATLYMTRVEYDYWINGKPNLSKSRLGNQEMFNMIIEGVRSILGVVKPQIKLIEDKTVILDCMQVEIAPGHTPGHIVTTIFSNDEKLWAITDIVHTNALFTNPKWGTNFDGDFELGIKTRLDILKRASESKALVFGFHQPYPAIGYVRQIGQDSYQWVPKNFVAPQLGK